MTQETRKKEIRETENRDRDTERKKEEWEKKERKERKEERKERRGGGGTQEERQIERRS